MLSVNSKKLLLVFAAAALFILAGCKIEDPIEVSFSGASESIPVGTSMTVRAETLVPGDIYQWFLDGVLLRGERSSSITIGSELEPSDYRLDLVVMKGNKIGRKGFSFSVTAETAGIAQWARLTRRVPDPEAGYGEGLGDGPGAYFMSTATGADGSIYCAGYIEGSVDFGTIDFGNGVTAKGVHPNANILLVKYDGSGNAQWAKTLVSGSGSSAFVSVSTAPDGSVYTAGAIDGDISPYDFGNGVTLTGRYYRNILLMKYDSSGKAQWARTLIQATDGSVFSSVSVAPDGSIYAAGNIGSPYVGGTIGGNDIYDFGNGVQITTDGSTPESILLVKYDSQGTARWVRTILEAQDMSDFSSVSVAPDGSVYAGGNMHASADVDLGNGVVVSPPELNGDSLALLVKYDSDGNAQWGKTISNISESSGFHSVSAASDGSVYAAGVIKGSAAFDFGNGVTVTGANPSNYNMMLVKYDDAGLAQWAETVMPESDKSVSRLEYVTTAPDGSVYAVGTIGGGSQDFGNGVTATGDKYENSVLLKYDSAGLARWAKTAIAGDDTSGLAFSGVSIAPDGAVYAVGSASGTLDLGNNVTVTDANGALLVKYR